MGVSRQEHWTALSCPPAADLPNPGIEAGSPALQADSSVHRSTVYFINFLVFQNEISFIASFYCKSNTCSLEKE